MENEQNGNTFFTTTVIVLDQISLVQNPKSKFCTRIFKYKNNNKYRLINLCTHFVVPLNERVRRKVGNVDLELVLRFPRLFYFIVLIVWSEYLFCCSLKDFLYNELNTYLSFNWPKYSSIKFTAFWPHFSISHYYYMYANWKPVMYFKTWTGAPMLIFLT